MGLKLDFERSKRWFSRASFQLTFSSKVAGKNQNKERLFYAIMRCEDFFAVSFDDYFYSIKSHEVINYMELLCGWLTLYIIIFRSQKRAKQNNLSFKKISTHYIDLLENGLGLEIIINSSWDPNCLLLEISTEPNLLTDIS